MTGADETRTPEIFVTALGKDDEVTIAKLGTLKVKAAAGRRECMRAARPAMTKPARHRPIGASAMVAKDRLA